MSRLLRSGFLLLLAAILPPAFAANSFNILVYHHVSEETPASTSISPTLFREHLQLIKDNGFQVVDLNEAISAVRNGTALAEGAVVITFDDGFNDIYTEGWPLLQEFNYPFTVFISTDAIDDGLGGMLSWDQIREMHSNGVTIANHTSDHDYLVRKRHYDQYWLNSVERNINNAQARLQQELGSEPPKWLAYPYGEYNLQLQQLVEKMGYIGFAQHSGGVWQGSDFLAVPRFAAAGIYSNPETLKVKLMSRPMPVTTESVQGMVTHQRQPVLTATISDRSDMSQVLNCFVDGTQEQVTWISDTEFQVQSGSELSTGRHRYNCTSRSLSGNFYYWLSKPWLVLDK
ncbi:polysaccharide deacetylase family protein [Reinekea marinisedimentorum]|uniref:Peptidoglycan/xylan/chitin deacetylase (PgdA/CDA1 family) n=1 Tax=Reinekea marinisedimentorum TaxID=230495 RepID=A0A4R3I7P2_9GAMM|nr:polysaccharide deacetylase family protein [Reinekea marinisedimentorum]TCS40151.1 peptidoglycan/xylan/chitin deacetylase (PgdA/CDA1 family) [Reinekea marinisedimentorum]